MDYSLLISVTRIDTKDTSAALLDVPTPSIADASDPLCAAAYRLSFKKAGIVGVSDSLALARTACTLPNQLAASSVSTGGCAGITRCVAKHHMLDAAGEHKAKAGDASTQAAPAASPSSDSEPPLRQFERVLIQVGVIDMLQAYDTGKKMENTIKDHSTRCDTCKAGA